MKIDLNSKLDSTQEMSSEVDKLRSRDRFTSIFKMNNGIALEVELNTITDDSYKYISTEESDNLKFIHLNEDCVEIDKNGEITNWPSILPAQLAKRFARIAQARLHKTNQMLDGILTT